MPLMLDYFEDLVIGTKEVFGSHTFTADEIKAFAQQFDPQPFHVDEEAAKHSLFGGLCACGWHSAALWMKLMVEARQRAAEARLRRGEAVPQMGPSPGFRDLRWFKPVFPGDTITYAAELVDKRPSASRPGWGLMTLRNSGTNQRGEIVLSWVSTAFVARRPA